jgi:hypothetical protein
MVLTSINLSALALSLSLFLFRLSGWNPARMHRAAVMDFLTQIRSHELDPVTRTTLEAEIVQVRNNTMLTSSSLSMLMLMTMT